MGKELTIISGPGTLHARTRPASWGFGFVLVGFLVVLWWLMFRSLGGENISMSRIQKLIGFGLVSLLFFGFMIFLAIGHRELRADSWGLVYSTKVLSLPLRTRRIPWEQVRDIRIEFIEAAPEEVGHTLEVKTTHKTYQFFEISVGEEELKQVVALLKQIKK